MDDLCTRILRAWHDTPLVSKFIASDEARAQRVVEMLDKGEDGCNPAREERLATQEAGPRQATESKSVPSSPAISHGLPSEALDPKWWTPFRLRTFSEMKYPYQRDTRTEFNKSPARQHPLEPVEQGDAGGVDRHAERFAREDIVPGLEVKGEDSSERNPVRASPPPAEAVLGPASPALPRYTTTVTVDDELGGNVSVRFRVDPEGAWVNAGAALARIADLERRLSKQAHVFEIACKASDDKTARISALEAENERLRDAIRELTRIGGSVLSSLKRHAGVTDYHSDSLIGRYVKASDAALDLFEPRAPAGETKTDEPGAGAESPDSAPQDAAGRFGANDRTGGSIPPTGATPSASPAPAWTEDQRPRVVTRAERERACQAYYDAIGNVPTKLRAALRALGMEVE